MADFIRPEIDRHLDRWNQSKHIWELHLRRMREFGLRRPAMIRQFLMEAFSPGYPVQLNLVAGEGGAVLLNDNLHLPTGPFQGTYFSDVPITLAAKSNFGYRFSHWEHLGKRNSPERLVVTIHEGSPTYKAVFEPYEHPLSGKIVINEIGPNNPNRKGGDWVEIYNSTKNKVSLKDWTLSDGKNQFILPDVQIPANDYLIICEDSLAFRQHYPFAFRVLGGLPFGINKRKESLILFNESMAGIDSLAYRIFPSDSTFSLSLLLPYLDNSNLENWTINETGGTPGQANPYYLESRIYGRQQAWLRVGVALMTMIVCVSLLWLRHTGQFDPSSWNLANRPWK